MASQAELRALMRRAASAAPVRRGTITSKLARYESDGRLACRVCNKVLGDDDALWDPHLLSAFHTESVAALKSKVPAKPSGATSSTTGDTSAKAGVVPLATQTSTTASSAVVRPPLSSAAVGAPIPNVSLRENPTVSSTDPPRKTTASVAAILNTSAASASHSGFGRRAGVSGRGLPTPSSVESGVTGSEISVLPAGFFDDVERDLRARGLDPKAVAQAALEREWQEFQEFAAIVDAAEEERVAAEVLSYEGQQEAAAVENALYRGRIDIVRFVQQKLKRDPTGDNSGNAQQPIGDSEVLTPSEEVLVDELGGPLSLLTTPDASIQAPGASELARIMMAAQKNRENRDAGCEEVGAIHSPEGESEGDDDPDALLDWRCVAAKRTRVS